MFEPRVRLVLQADGTFNLAVSVQVPTSCYWAGQLRAGLPGGMVGIPEISYFTFTINHEAHEFCSQLVHDVSASLSYVRLEAGHSTIAVLVVVDGKVIHGTVISVPGEKGLALSQSLRLGHRPPSGGAVLLPDTLTATALGGIVGPTVLTVSCLVWAPSGGYRAALTPVRPGGFNPRILILELEILSPKGPVIEPVCVLRPQYVEQPFKFQYSQVSLISDNSVVTVPIHMIYALEAARFRRAELMKDFVSAAGLNP